MHTAHSVALQISISWNWCIRLASCTASLLWGASSSSMRYTRWWFPLAARKSPWSVTLTAQHWASAAAHSTNSPATSQLCENRSPVSPLRKSAAGASSRFISFLAGLKAAQSSPLRGIRLSDMSSLNLQHPFLCSTTWPSSLYRHWIPRQIFVIGKIQKMNDQLIWLALWQHTFSEVDLWAQL